LNRMSPITIIDHASIMTHPSREFPIFLLSSSSYHLQVMCGSSWAVAFVRLYRLFGSDCGTPIGWTTLAAGERGAPGYFILFFPACHLAGSAACRQLEGAVGRPSVTTWPVADTSSPTSVRPVAVVLPPSPPEGRHRTKFKPGVVGVYPTIWMYIISSINAPTVVAAALQSENLNHWCGTYNS
jgi:hypothetical protein